jgi:hypothetical protein
MSDAIHIEQRLHDLEQRLHHMIAGLGRRNGRAKSGEDSPREMERQVVDRLFKEPRRTRPQPNGYDAGGAREVEREAIKRLYGDRRPTVVVEARDNGKKGS